MTDKELPDEAHEQWKAERNRILRELDIASAPGTTDDIKLCSLHKARYECTEIDPRLRNDSRKWLEERGFKRLYQMEFSTDGSLPK